MNLVLLLFLTVAFASGMIGAWTFFAPFALVTVVLTIVAAADEVSRRKGGK
jgi:hypothetical protein